MNVKEKWDESKAIADLHSYLSPRKIKPSPNAVEIAIKALYRCIPIEPDFFERMPEIENLVCNDYRCPTCETAYMFIEDDMPNYCRVCGQAFNWGKSLTWNEILQNAKGKLPVDEYEFISNPENAKASFDYKAIRLYVKRPIHPKTLREIENAANVLSVIPVTVYPYLWEK